MTRHDVSSRLAEAINGLRRRSPEMSAARTLDGRQRIVIAAVVSMIAVGFVFRPRLTGIVFVAVTTFIYVASLAYRVSLFRRGLARPSVITVSDDEARAIADEELPLYSVLIPAYREPELIGELIAAINGIEYPRNRLDVKLLLEEDDEETIRAASAARRGPHIEIVLVPAAEPRTKPKALNYGLASAIGEYVTIYDAEDRPDKLQLRRAVAAFRRVGPSVACLQAKLSYHNAEQNVITRWFTAEYDAWFSQLLPGIGNGPIPLGGTSNHFRRVVLVRAGAWDPFNVTEDADLGIRLYRRGWTAAVLDSTTFEEANSDFVNWVKQRSRWYKGYFQTWLVHSRRPRELWRQLGPRGFVGFNLFVGGTPLLALINPFFWGLTLLWFVGKPEVIQSIFPAPLYYIGLLCWALGNVAVLYMNMISARAVGKPELLLTTLTSPLYWLMMSIAAVKGLLQLVKVPSFWEKTTHGLTISPQADRTEARLDVAG
jgi:glycosyltransferase XagB